MEKIKVFIENLPAPPPWYREWIPIIIALIALITSVISVYYARKGFIKNTRPFVWASNFGSLEPKTQIIINHPNVVAFRVKNSPAKVINLKIELSLENEKVLFTASESNIVRFPDEKSQWTYNIAPTKFDSILTNIDSNELKHLRRKIYLEYQGLDGGKTYFCELRQEYVPIDKNWKNIFENAN